MADLRAVPPARGEVIHLHDPDYRPSPRQRGVQNTSGLCGYLISPPGVLLEQALPWTERRPTTTDPRPPWRWCRLCLGHVVELAGLADTALADVARRLSRTTNETRTP